MSKQKKRRLITIVGPTAIGKTALSIHLANHFSTEIISCDSRQFFKEMTIGTAVPSDEEMKEIPHHFIQNISIQESYSVGQFERDALKKLHELFKKYDTVIMVGGSGLYVDAVVKGLDDFPEIDPSIRDVLNSRLKEEGIKNLQQQLKQLDFESYKTIAVNNPHRLIRALEICIGTGKTYSSFKNRPKKIREFESIKVGLSANREVIYDRINLRVDLMINAGLINEAKHLLQFKELNALQTVGYRELFSYFNGNCTKNEAIEEIKKNTRRFAKRQITWFKKDQTIKWFDYQTPIDEIISEL